MKYRNILSALFATLFVSSAIANIYTVINTDDSGPGSLRQAILDANANIGADTISFNIPGTGVHTITPLTPLPTITDGVTIDGYTQPGSSANTVADSDNAVLKIELDGSDPSLGNVSGLTIDADNCEARGLVINRFPHDAIDIHSNGNLIDGNFIGTNAAGTSALPNGASGNGGIIAGFGGSPSNNTIGGTTPGARNLISGNIGVGISLGFTGNIVQGNFIGTDVTGTVALGNSGVGVSADGSNLTVGGTTAAARNIISANNRGIALANGSDNIIQGNFIGTDVTGTIALGNQNEGLSINGGSNNVVGGLTSVPGTGAGNLISGNVGIGLDVFTGAALNTLIEGNIIGADITGTQPLGNSLAGVSANGNDSIIGGTDLSAANIIAFNGGSGIAVGGVNNALLGNSIFSNAGLGIDLVIAFDGPGGVTLNDAGDADTGPNNLENYPTIATVTTGGYGSTVTLTGALDSTPSTTFRLEFFSNVAGDGSGFGEGKTFIGTTDVTTDASGAAAYNVTFSLVSAAEAVFTATATDAGGNTSEFSPAFATRLLNISTRMEVLTGDQVLIGGFIITGTGLKNVILRGIGPSLAAFGVSGALADPILELHDGQGAILASNDDWQDTQQDEIEATGLSPGDDHESAIVTSLEPGSYTAILAGTNDSTGIGLVEVYDLDQSAGSKLANISTRGFVDTGDNVMIGGIIVGPTDTGIGSVFIGATVLIRAIGPSLGNFGVSDPLQDPVLELHDGQGAILASNDDWQDTQQDEIEATGIPPTDTRESAIVETLAPGAYTAIVRGKNDTTGIALVEAYHLD